MRDLSNPKWMYLKAALLLLILLCSGGMLLSDAPTWRTGVLLALVVWASARLYYFMFYVIERYIDPSYRFSGILSALSYLVGRETSDVTTARCSCGSVELEARGAPILSAACCCDDCQQGARQLEQLPNAPPVCDPDAGTAYLLYRKDRMKCSKGSERLRDYRLTKESRTRRVVATCCNSAMFLDFERGHWFSVYRARFGGAVPRLQMRVQTRFLPPAAHVPGDVPSYSRIPLKFIVKLVAARIAMLFHR
jgi:hypothetical protein